MGCSSETDWVNIILALIFKELYKSYYSLMFSIACAFKGHVHVFAGRVKIVSLSSCRTSAILKYFCPLHSVAFFPVGFNRCSQKKPSVSR